MPTNKSVMPTCRLSLSRFWISSLESRSLLSSSIHRHCISVLHTHTRLMGQPNPREFKTLNMPWISLTKSIASELGHPNLRCVNQDDIQHFSNTPKWSIYIVTSSELHNHESVYRRNLDSELTCFLHYGSFPTSRKKTDSARHTSPWLVLCRWEAPWACVQYRFGLPCLIVACNYENMLVVGIASNIGD